MRISESFRDGPKLPSKGHLWWRKEFYSFFSTKEQQKANPEVGVWRNVWFGKVEHFIYVHNYRLWYWWANRPNSSARREIEKWFPGLRNK